MRRKVNVRVRTSGAGIITGPRCVYITSQCFCAISTLWQSLSPPNKSFNIAHRAKPWLTYVSVETKTIAKSPGCVCADLYGRKTTEQHMTSSWPPPSQVFYHSRTPVQSRDGNSWLSSLMRHMKRVIEFNCLRSKGVRQCVCMQHLIVIWCMWVQVGCCWFVFMWHCVFKIPEPHYEGRHLIMVMMHTFCTHADLITAAPPSRWSI